MVHIMICTCRTESIKKSVLDWLTRQTPSGQNPPPPNPRQTNPGQTPPRQTPPRQTPPRQTPPEQTSPGRHPLGRHPPPSSRRLLQQTVHIILECILVLNFYDCHTFSLNFWWTHTLLRDHWYLCFGLLMTSPLGFKACHALNVPMEYYKTNVMTCMYILSEQKILWISKWRIISTECDILCMWWQSLWLMGLMILAV